MFWVVVGLAIGLLVVSMAASHISWRLRGRPGQVALEDGRYRAVHAFSVVFVIGGLVLIGLIVLAWFVFWVLAHAGVGSGLA